MSELKQSIAQLLIDNFKGTTTKRASDMAIAIMAFVNADRDRSAGYCAPSSTGECSCRKWADDPTQCDRRAQPEADANAKDAERLDFMADQSNKTVSGYEINQMPFSDGTSAWFFFDRKTQIAGKLLGTSREAIDAAIDAARQAKENGNG